MRKVVFLRHGQTDWNAQLRFQGQSDIPLNATGISQARRSGRMLASLKPDLVVASDLGRAVDTAKAVTAWLPSMQISTDPQLRETFMGQWEGMRDPDIASGYPELLAQWESGSSDVRAGVHGETRAEVAQRMAQGVLDVVEQLPADGTALVVSHGGAIKCGLLTLMGIPRNVWGSVSGLANCHWSILRETGAESAPWRLMEHNAGSLPEPVLGEED